jgi:hypothetical protein
MKTSILIKVNTCLLLSIFLLFISEFSYAQKINSTNIMQYWMDSIQDYKAKNWGRLSINTDSIVYNYYDLCHSHKDNKLKAIAFKNEFENVADSLTIWLQNNNLLLIASQIGELNCGSTYCGNDFERTWRTKFYHQVWLDLAQNYRKHAKENPTKYIALLLLSKQNEEALVEATKYNMKFLCTEFYTFMAMCIKPPKNLVYIEKYFTSMDSTKIPLDSYRFFGYMACQAKAYTKAVEYLEKVPPQQYNSDDCSYLGEAYLGRGSSSADTTKAVSLLFEAIKKGQQEAQKR